MGLRPQASHSYGQERALLSGPPSAGAPWRILETASKQSVSTRFPIRRGLTPPKVAISDHFGGHHLL